jgi:hypothetical protein
VSGEVNFICKKIAMLIKYPNTPVMMIPQKVRRGRWLEEVREEEGGPVKSTRAPGGLMLEERAGGRQHLEGGRPEVPCQTAGVSRDMESSSNMTNSSNT